MKILFDQNTPWGLRKPLSHHEVTSAWKLGWSEVRNGELLALAEKAGFDLFLTGDQNIRYQQNLSERRISIVELTTAHWPSIPPCFGTIVEAVDRAQPGSYSIVKCAFRRDALTKSGKQKP